MYQHIFKYIYIYLYIYIYKDIQDMYKICTKYQAAGPAAGRPGPEAPRRPWLASCCRLKMKVAKTTNLHWKIT